MKILICSLQVSEGASKGHLHPAIELGLALQSRGHKVGLLPLPSPLSVHDKTQLSHCHFELVEPPLLTNDHALVPEKLAALAKTSLTVARAYHAFLIEPLELQFSQVIDKISAFNPDIVV